MAKKNVLFITPVLPSLSRRGRNFRAYQWVWRLHREYRVSVFCTSVYGQEELEGDDSTQDLECDIYTSEHTYSTFQRVKNLMTLKPSTWNEVGDVIIEGMKDQKIPVPDVILCFRIQNASAALHTGRSFGTPDIWLDIDEVDSGVKYNIANQMFDSGYFWKGIKEWMEATLYSFRETRLVPEFDTVFASTREEEKSLQNLHAPKTEVFGNMLPGLKRDKIVESNKTPFTFMFVGDSNYFPNLDAINFLLFDIIPGLDKMSETSFKFIIVGGFVGRVQHEQMKKYDCITYYQDINDLKSIYDQSHAVVVPLRAGGGSSLKFLEALRYKKSVVSTPIGARGFDVSNGVQALIGEDSDSIVEYCLKLMGDKELSRNLAKKGHQWFLENHSFDVELVEDLEIA